MMATWQTLGQANFRKWPIYDMEWGISDLEMESSLCIGAPNAGPLAVIKKQNLDVVTPKPMEDAGRMYSMSGKLLSVFSIEGEWIAPGGIGWTKHQHLVIVYKNGLIMSYEITGKRKKYSLTSEVYIGEIDCTCVYSEGVIFITSGGKIGNVQFVKSSESWAISWLNDGQSVYERQGIQRCTSMCVLDPATTRQRKLRVIVSTNDGGLIRISTTSQSTQLQIIYHLIGANAHVVKMAPASNGKFLACFLSNGMLTVVDTILEKALLEFDTKADVEPLHMLWCGEDAIVMHWKQIGILMVGPFGDWIKYTYHSELFLVHEIDCCRIFSGDTAEILQVVPKCTVDLREIGSFAPSAMLFDAIEAFDNGDPTSDENIRALKEEGKLVDAVLDCIQAAVAEFDISIQQSLLRVASSGKAFCTNESDRRLCTTAFTSACNILRALNAVRHGNVGIPLTIKQFHNLSPYGVVSRLMIRRHYFLALKLCDYLRIKAVKYRVIVDWACEKIDSEYRKLSIRGTTGEEMLEMDTSIFENLSDKLQECNGISLARVAAAADSHGRRALATDLINLEQRIHIKVVQLLEMNEYDLAMKCAIESNDTNLLYHVIFQSRREQQLVGDEANEKFLKLLGKYPISRNLWIAFLKQSLTAEDAYEESINLNATTCYGRSGPPENMLSCLESLGQTLREGYEICQCVGQLATIEDQVHCLHRAHRVFAKSKENIIHSGATEDQIRLLEVQKELEQQIGTGSFKGYSVIETVYKCMELDLNRYVHQLKKDFRIPDKKMWYLRLKAFAKCEDWSSLETFANHKKSPIGYIPFADWCIRKKNFNEASKYIARIDDVNVQVEMYVSIEHWEDAIESAKRAKDVSLLEDMLRNKDLPLNLREVVNASLQLLARKR